MKELAALDDGRQVDLVLGLVTPARGIATTMHQVGEAFTPGRHIIMRGMDDEEEGKALEREFHLLSETERSRLYGDRRNHKEIVLFLHEWGHTAGLLHQEDRATIMNPEYDRRQSGFSEFDKQVLALVVAERVAHRDQELPERADLLALYQKAPPAIGSAEDGRTSWPTWGSGRSGRRPRSRSRPDVSPSDAETFDRAMAASKANRQKEAWTIFAPSCSTSAREGHHGGVDARSASGRGHGRPVRGRRGDSGTCRVEVPRSRQWPPRRSCSGSALPCPLP